MSIEEKRRFASVWPACLVIFLCAGLVSEALAQQTILIKNALLFDGSGDEPRSASVRLAGDRIAAVGDLRELHNDVIVDAGGMALAPGFIDTHSHHDRRLDEDTAATAAISQGITTIVVGQDGNSEYPLADFFARRAANPATVNIASYSGHSTLRSLAVRPVTGKPGEASLERMQAMLQSDLDAGALGLSTGLEYEPGMYAESGELLALAKIAAAAGGRYSSHMRSEDTKLYNALREVIFIGRRAAIPVHISHMKLASRSLWGSASKVLQVLDQARAVGIDVTADIYPYTYWQSTMQVLMPERDFTDLRAAEFALTELTTPEGMRLTSYAADPTLVGSTIAEIAKDRGEEPAVTYLWLINQSINAGDGKHHESVTGESMTEEDIRVLMNWEHMNFCSDGALKDSHPRGAGSFPRVFSRYVKEMGAMPFESAVRKATSVAAKHVGLQNRGYIRADYFADLVLFDPETIADRATVAEPHAQAAGIRAVWVNGQQVYDDGGVTSVRPGRVLRRH